MAMDASPPIPRLTPELTDRYRIVGSLGDGANGSVYRGVQQRSGAAVAIKVLNAELDDPDRAKQRLNREGRVLQALQIPHVIRCLDQGVAPGSRPYLVLEYSSGERLSDHLAEAGALPTLIAVEIGRQIAEALAGLHGAGILHRDLSPENVLIEGDLQRDPYVRLIDFGLVGLDGPGRAKLGLPDLTAPGTRMGTPWYTAPEQHQSPASDLYALGIMMFEMITGAVPFEDTDSVALRMAHTWTRAPRLSERAPGIVPRALDELIADLLAKDPRSRPARADEIVTRLAHIIEIGGEGTPAPVIADAEEVGELPRGWWARIKRLWTRSPQTAHR